MSAHVLGFEAFEGLAWQFWEEIPAEYREGVDGLVIKRGARAHPSLPEVYTLGECLTESYPSEYGGPETIRSAVVLYYGSFLRLARECPEFDWERELWETLVHELQHHLESLAREDAFEALDYAMDENFKRLQGEPFDPLFYRSGLPVDPGVWQVEDDIFLEREYREESEFGGGADPGPRVEFDWRGARYTVTVEGRLGDVAFIWLEAGVALEAGEELYLVLVRRRGLGRLLRSFLTRERMEVVQYSGVASII